MKNLLLQLQVCAYVVAALILLNDNSLGQRINTATLTSFSGGYSTINGQGGTVTLASFGGSVYYSTATMSLPFAFRYDDVSYSAGTTVYVRQGHICLNPGGSPDPNYQSYVGNASYPNIIVPLMGLQVSAPDGSSRWFYQLSGSAPNRVLTFEWYKWGDYPSQSLGSTSYQLKLYETSNNIEFIYQDANFTMNNASYASYVKSTGLNGNPTPSFVYSSIQSGTTVTPKFNYRYSYYIPPNVQLSSSPKVLDYGSTVIGFSTTQNVIVTNVGNDLNGISKLSIKSLTLTGDPDFTIVSAPASFDSITVGSTRPIAIKFTPQLDGIRQASLTIVSSGNDSGTQVISLKGIGLAALISVDTNVLFKNKFTRMGTSVVARVLITSTGVPTLSILGFQFTGVDAGEFSIAQNPSSMSIAGGKTDSIFIRYTPTKEGRHIATLNIINNSINNPILPITLWGTGTLPHIIVTPNIALFDSVTIGTEVCKTIRLTNPGTDTLLITSNTMVSNDGDFKYTGLVGMDSVIPPDKFKEVTVCFRPISKGSRVARLRFTTNIPKTFEPIPRDTASMFLLDMRGTGVPFGQLTQKIGAIEGAGWTDESIINKEICTNDTIWNNGGADILVSSMALSGGSAANYKVSGKTLPFIVKANSYAVVTLCCTPTTQGPNPATLTISGTSSEKAISSVATLSIKGLMVCATATPNPLFDGHLVLENTDSAICVDVTNCGDVPTDYTASLPSGTDYTISGTNPSGVIAPGAKATFCIHFNPKTMGEAKTTLTITPSTSELAPLAIPVGGIGACANVTAPAMTATTIGKGGHRPFSITITNNGNYDWTPGNAVITPNDGIFLLDNAVPTITANGSQTVTGTFNPDDINKTYSATLTFDGSAPACAAAVSVPLTGQSDASGVASKTEEAGFSLGQNYPNPFASVTTFSFTTPTEAQIVLSISDLTGRQIKVITSGNVSSGEHTVQFDASQLSSGSYIITLESGAIRLARQIVVAR